LKKEERVNNHNSISEGQFVHIVTLDCKDEEHARRCVEALANYGKPDALAFNCVTYEFGIKEGTAHTVYLIERWRKWQDLDSLLKEKVVPALPVYNQLLKRPFDPSKDTVRIALSSV
jgi:quinol monooxygenase YgiN